MAAVDKRSRVSLTPETAKIVSLMKDRNPKLSTAEAINELIRLAGLKLEIGFINESNDKIDEILEQLLDQKQQGYLTSDQVNSLKAVGVVHKIVYQMYALLRRFVATYDEINQCNALAAADKDLKAYGERQSGRQQ